MLLDNLDELKNGWKNCYKTGAKQNRTVRRDEDDDDEYKEREIIA